MSGMTECDRCGSAVIEVPLDLGADRLAIVRCARCDSHRWERNGEVIELEEVLDLTASTWGSRTAARGGARR